MPHRHSRLLVKELALGALVGAGSGLLFFGIGWRLIMRAIVLWAGQSPSFWWLATLGIVGTGTVIGLASGLLFIGFRRILRKSCVRSGVGFSLTLFVLLLWQMPESVRRELEAYPQFFWHSLTLFAATFLAHGVVLGRWVGLRPATIPTSAGKDQPNDQGEPPMMARRAEMPLPRLSDGIEAGSRI